MLVLVVDSSTPAVTAALAEITRDRVALVAQRRTVDARAHGELLAPQVDAVLAEGAARPTDLSAIVAGLGPGPFTGLRVGLVTAATMGQVLGIPTYGVCSLDAIGHAAVSVENAAADTAADVQAEVGTAADVQAGTGTGARGGSGSGRLLAASDARRREIYWAVYGPVGERLLGPEVAAPAAVADRAASLGITVAVGDGAMRYAETLRLPLREEPRYPPAYALAELAAERVRAEAPGERLTPLYLRRPDAVAAAARKSVLP